MRLPVVCLVGRPNVGKSTLFNRLVGQKISIVEDTPGVTRDRIYGMGDYRNYKFHVIDTGGIDLSAGTFNDEIKMQVSLAIDEADVVIFIVDGKEGITANDIAVSQLLKKSNKEVIVAINKIDNKQSQANMYDFYEFGFDKYIPISAEHNIGVADLLDEVVEGFRAITEDQYDEEMIKFSVIGRPNVGKSSLVNAILNEERVIVSEVAGTTRDAIDTVFAYDKKDYVVIDTAGLRKKGRIYENIEKYSYLRAMKAIDRSDICLLIINAEEGIIEHDKHIMSYALEAGKGIVIVVNKWDVALEKDMKKYSDIIRNEFKFVSYAPIVFLSALTKKRIHTLMPEILRVGENIKKEIKTSLLNDVVMDAVALNPPPSYKGKRLKVYFTSQTGIKPPKITFNVNSKTLVHFSYERYLENKIRENFDFEGTPIILQFKNKNEKK